MDSDMQNYVTISVITLTQTRGKMYESEPRPVVTASEEAGIWHLTVQPVTAIRGLQLHIDARRSTSVNFAGITPNYVNLRVGPADDITKIIGSFADVEISNAA